MERQEHGSTLIIVMLAVSILTIMGVALSSSLMMSARARSSMLAGTQSLMTDRTGLLDIYAFMQRDWAVIWKSLTSDATKPPDLQAVNLALAQLQSDTQAWIDSTVNTGQSYDKYGAVLDAQIVLGSNNEQSLSLTNTQLLQNYNITITADKNGISRRFSDIVTVGGPFVASATGYAAFATNNLYLTGAPEIDGNIAAEGQVLIDRAPWYWTGGQGDGVHAPRLAPDTAEQPLVNPAVNLGSFTALGQVNGLAETFTEYSDGGNGGGDGSLSLSTFVGQQDSSPTFGPADATALSNITTVVDGNPVQLKTISSGNSVDVNNAVTMQGDTILAQLSNLTKVFGPGDVKQNVEQAFGKGGEIHWNESDSHACTIDSAIAQDTNSLPVYFDGGSLVINSQGSLTLTQPMYVNGDLIIAGAGKLTSSQPIYVSGNVILATATSNTEASSAEIPLNIYSQGDIFFLGNLKQARIDHSYDANSSGDSQDGNHSSDSSASGQEGETNAQGDNSQSQSESGDSQEDNSHSQGENQGSQGDNGYSQGENQGSQGGNGHSRGEDGGDQGGNDQSQGDVDHHNADTVPANTPTAIYGNFASAKNIYVDGMYGDYQIVGQLYGTNIVLNGTTGDQSVTPGSDGMLQPTVASESSYRRLVLTGGGGGPTQGPAGLVNLQVLPLPQPTLGSP